MTQEGKRVQKTIASKVPESTWHLAHYLARRRGLTVSALIKTLIEREANETHSNGSK